MNVKLIGIGAAGNKAAIAAIENRVIDKSNTLLINSTMKDIPHDYDGEKYCFNGAYGGCGKERKIAKKHILADLKSGSLNLNKFLEIGVEGKQAELVVIVSSTEGGTGSGSAPVLAKWIKGVLHIEAVRCFSFVGFADDVRGLRNTVEYFEELEDMYAIESVDNQKYMDDAGDDKIKAEKLANEDFCVKLSVLMGNMIRESEHNIDQTDHLKVCKTPNFSIVEYKEFGKLKNKKDFRDMLEDMIDNSKSIDINTPSQVRLAVIVNIDEASTGVLDYKDILKERFGEWGEIYEHIEHETSLPHFFAFITTGNKVPVKEIEQIYESYKERSSRMDTAPDEFYSKKFQFDEQDERLDLAHDKSSMSAADFFESFDESPKTTRTVSVSTSKGASVTDPY